jgi:pimeloyl-ACP methyl ester carboxylesterase
MAVLPAQTFSQSVRINGADIHYETHGAGEPLLLLHGFGSCGRQAWAPYIDALSAKFRVIVPDMRGHGASTNPSGKFTHRQAALDMLALLDSLGIHRVSAIGASSGAMTLLHMATQQPPRIDAMILVDATSYFPTEARRVMRRFANPDSLPPMVRKLYADCATRGEPQVRELLSQFSGFKDSYDDMNFTPPVLGTIQARTLIIHGDRDPLFPLTIPIEMYRSIPRSALWIVPNAGHEGPLVPETKNIFLEAALKFLAPPLQRP